MKTTLSLPALMVTLLWLGTMGKCDEDAAGPEVPAAPVEGGGQESAAHVCPMYCLRRPPLCRPPSVSLLAVPKLWMLLIWMQSLIGGPVRCFVGY